MGYITVQNAADRWNVSERTIRKYCREGRIPGVRIENQRWLIPENAIKPQRRLRSARIENQVYERLLHEKESQLKGGLYHDLQIKFTFNTNHMEGSCLTEKQTALIFDTNSLGLDGEILNVDDIVETVNHFRCIDYVIDQAECPLTQKMIKNLHSLLKSGSSDSRKSWFAVGDYKRVENEVGQRETTPAVQVPYAMEELLNTYGRQSNHTLEQLMEFHVAFERIHPFQDGNGRIGRLILLKECLKNGIVPFIITDDLKYFYYRGLQEWDIERGYLRDTFLMAQDRFKRKLDSLNIPY